MSDYHEEILTRAVNELKENEHWEFEMGSKENAHREYMNLRKTMKRKNFYQKDERRKGIKVSRKGSTLIIEVGKYTAFPEPLKISDDGRKVMN